VYPPFAALVLALAAIICTYICVEVPPFIFIYFSPYNRTSYINL
jgi:hypothetical protein